MVRTSEVGTVARWPAGTALVCWRSMSPGGGRPPGGVTIGTRWVPWPPDGGPQALPRAGA